MIYIFLDFLQVRYNCAKLHQCGICKKGFKQAHPQPWIAPKRPILNRERCRKGGKLRKYILLVALYHYT